MVILKQDEFQVTQPYHLMLSQLQKLTQQGTLVMSSVWDGEHITCAHCIVAAEDNNELQEFLTWFTAFKGKKSNLTDAIYHGTYKHAELKKPPRRRYGDAIHLPTVQKTDRLALSDISNLGNSDTACAQLPADQSKCVGQGNLKNTQSQSTIASSAMQPSGTLHITIPGQDNPQNIPATVTAHSRVNDNSVNLG